MQNDHEFLVAAAAALDGLKRHLIARAEIHRTTFEVSEQNGALNILFDDPGARFVVTPNAPLRQIWITAINSSFQLNWDSRMEEFILPRSGETLIVFVDRLIGEHHAV